MHFSQAAAKYGEILRKNIYKPAINGTPPSNDTIARVFLFIQIEIVGTMNDERIGFVKRTLVE